MPPSRQVIYVDTNVIIEATRTGCWKAIINKFDGRLISLEELATQCGQKPKLKDWFGKKWLRKARSEFLLDSL